MNLTKLSVLAMVLFITACSPQQLGSVLNDVQKAIPLTNAQIGNGLKEALEVGVKKGATQLSALNGYFESPYKILLPPEARQITDRLQKIPGFKQIENEIVKKLNRGAEKAAEKAAPIFVNAIKQMSIQDATAILMGQKNAATTFLQDKTLAELTNAFNPIIQQSLDEVKAREVWSKAINTYNKIPLITKANPNLDEYVTSEALKGLFSMVEKEEGNIRSNVSARTSDLLKKVFAKQDN